LTTEKPVRRQKERPLKKRSLLLTLLIATGIATAAEPTAPVLVHHGFYTGNLYNALPEPARRTYVTGVIDGLMISPLLGVEKRDLAWFENCVTGMQDNQSEAVVDRYVATHPERWDDNMALLVFGAMQDACATRGFPRK
jgi:hypothetical protein